MDWNNDGKLDLIAGDTRGNVTLFLNVGTPQQPRFAAGIPVQAAGKVITAKSHPGTDTYSKLHVADLNGDGVKDLLIGYSTSVLFFRGEPAAAGMQFAAPVPLSIPALPFRPSPYVVDLDEDGTQDLVLGTEEEGVVFYRNIGTNQVPRLAKGVKLDLKVPKAEAGYRWRIDVTDWNNDGKKDLLVGTFYGTSKKSGGHIWLFLGK